MDKDLTSVPGIQSYSFLLQPKGPPKAMPAQPNYQSLHYQRATIKYNNQTLNGPSSQFHYQPSWHPLHRQSSAHLIPLDWSLVPLLGSTSNCSSTLKSPSCKVNDFSFPWTAPHFSLFSKTEQHQRLGEASLHSPILLSAPSLMHLDHSLEP